MDEPLTKKALTFVEQELSTDVSHDYWHAIRVWRLAKRIAEELKKRGAKLDLEVVELSALLQDVADHKFPDAAERRKRLEAFLQSLPLSDEQKKHILHIVDNMSFGKQLSSSEELSLEGKAVSDADKLDALGAIGIARVFAYSGKHNRPIHLPEVKARKELTTEAYRKKPSPTSITHFYEKLLKLKDMLYTEPAKELAAHRHRFMELFLEEFFAEWDGKR